MTTIQDIYAGSYGMPVFQPGDIEGLQRFFLTVRGDVCFKLRVTPDSPIERVERTTGSINVVKG